MENERPFFIQLLIETHAGLNRQGPGSPEATQKALSFLEPLGRFSQVADLGCGTGGQTLFLAQNVSGAITGLDLFPDFIDILDQNAQRQNLGQRVKGVVGSMDDLPFERDSFDLIWSEGAIDNIGFEKGLSHWRSFLRKNGCVAVTAPSWLTNERPSVVEKFWTDAGSGLEAIGTNVEIMQKCGYQFIASFALPEYCWTENYFAPREAAIQALLKKYAGNKTMEEYAAQNQQEVELYSKYKQYYGYVFYLGRVMTR